MKLLIGRGMVALATALSFTLALFSMVAGAWPQGMMHLFITIVLLGAYLRPMDFSAFVEVQGRGK